MTPLDCIIETLRDALNQGDDDHFISVCELAVEKLQDLPDAFEAIEPMIRMIECNPSVDFGMPGPLVHFVETYFGRGYEQLLIDSVERKPTHHTLWMLQRLINGSRGEQRNRLIRLLEQVIGRDDLSVELKQEAMRYRKSHT